ncbi:hypothetical protein E2C01_063048 [Portunus trituberculatus]|uniref:Uncharacterized protein n=1 Tax=Portunus trituberculatus TaxID=210409 RepID=A0A5B7HJ79_PORTR|nr:hypothetical protein [Portunus trituberculatus]
MTRRNSISSSINHVIIKATSAYQRLVLTSFTFITTQIKGNSTRNTGDTFISRPIHQSHTSPIAHHYLTKTYSVSHFSLLCFSVVIIKSFSIFSILNSFFLYFFSFILIYFPPFLVFLLIFSFSIFGFCSFSSAY